MSTTKQYVYKTHQTLCFSSSALVVICIENARVKINKKTRVQHRCGEREDIRPRRYIIFQSSVTCTAHVYCELALDLFVPDVNKTHEKEKLMIA